MTKLKITTPTDREIAMTRVFDAPRELVFAAYTTPALLKRWLGVRAGWTLDVCEVDLRVGGEARYVWRHVDGRSMGMRGVWREIVAPARLVATEQFDDPWYAGDAVNTVELTEAGGKTTFTTTVRYASRDVRDAVIRSPMESGVSDSFDKLDEVLAATGGETI